MRRLFAATLVASSCVLALGACGSKDSEATVVVTVTATPSTASSQQPSAAPVAPSAAASTPTLRASIPATVPTLRPTIRATAPATTAPAATSNQGRRGIPAGAKELTPVSASLGGPATIVATIKSPTGTIGCDLQADGYNGCGVEAWIRSNKFPGGNGDARWWVGLDDGVPTVGQKGDAPWYAQTKATVVPYGTTVYYGHIVCSSAPTGMTCWNTNTGHGAFMSRDEFKPF